MEVGPLFKPFRALGYITDNVPFAVNRRGKETYVTVSVGKAWQVYNCTKLLLTAVGPQFSGDIRALAVKNDLTFAAVGGDVVECKRLHRSGVYAGGHCGPIRQLLVLGDLLFSLGGAGERDRRLVVWDIGNYTQPKRVIEFEEGFVPICLAHPDTYLNKVLVGSEGGQLQLWNFASGKLLYTFRGWGCSVTCLAPSPALDVVGVGLADGRAVLHDVRYDEEVVTFSNVSGAGLAAESLLGGGAGTAAAAGGGGGGGACTALSFRSGAGVPLLAAGGGSGVVTVWNLEERRLHTVVREAHDGPLLALHWFAGEPLLMSAAADNSLKHWLFDSADAVPRLLRFRAGHSAPPTCVRHYGEGGLRLLSAGCDRSFRVFSVHQDQQSRELSQKHVERRARKLRLRPQELKLERVVDVDAREIRERDWANVITAHEGDPAAYTWRLAHFSLGDHVLTPPEEELCGSPPAPATCVALSHCGNFGLVGSAAGRIDRYNMQSGLHRGAYNRRQPAGAGAAAGPAGGAAGRQRGGSVAAPGAGLIPAHCGAVVGVAADAANRLLVSAGLDGWLRVWDFRGGALRAEAALGCPASRLALHPGSGLAAVARADAAIQVYDVEAVRLVRRFRGHSDRVTGLHISSDSRWLLSSSMDGTMRVWDVPAAQCLQVMKLGSPVTSLSLSPSLDLLATTHVNRRGIYLWSNQALFGSAAAAAAGEAGASVRVVRAHLPTISDGRRRGGRGAAGGHHEGGDGDRMAVDGRGEEGGRQEEEEGREEDGDEVEDEDGSGEEEEDESEEGNADGEDAARRAAGAAAGASPSAPQPLPTSAQPYAALDPVSGAPLPLSPELVTLSLLPRSHWDSLAHIEVIKARNKPMQPPKKPEAAPFFLPTLPGLGGTPTFDTAAGAGAGAGAGGEAAEKEAAADGADEGGEGEGGAGPGPGSAAAASAGGSRVGRIQGAAAVSPFLRLLREAAAAAAAARAKDGGGGGGGAAGGSEVEVYGRVMACLRGMTPTAIDRELRALTVLEGGSSEAAEVADLGALLDMLAACLAARRDFEFCQALLAAVLAAQGDVIASRPELAARASPLQTLVAASWGRLDSLLQGVRCMLGFFANMQG